MYLCSVGALGASFSGVAYGPLDISDGQISSL
jgi:hypothetical protein